MLRVKYSTRIQCIESLVKLLHCQTLGGVKIGYINSIWSKSTYWLTLRISSGCPVKNSPCMYSCLVTWEIFLSNIWQPDSLEAVGALCVLSVDPEMHCWCPNSCKVSELNAIQTPLLTIALEQIWASHFLLDKILRLLLWVRISAVVPHRRSPHLDFGLNETGHLSFWGPRDLMEFCMNGTGH